MSDMKLKLYSGSSWHTASGHQSFKFASAIRAIGQELPARAGFRFPLGNSLPKTFVGDH
jgi:hypothetical protein